MSTRVASLPIDTDTELREAVTYLARACAEVDQAFGWAMRTELADTLLESAKSYGVTCATLYGNMILNNLHKYVEDRHAAFKKVHPDLEPASSWLYENLDFPLSENMLAQAKREAAQHKASSPSKKGPVQVSSPQLRQWPYRTQATSAPNWSRRQVKQRGAARCKAQEHHRGL